MKRRLNVFDDDDDDDDSDDGNDNQTNPSNSSTKNNNTNSDQTPITLTSIFDNVQTKKLLQEEIDMGNLVQEIINTKKKNDEIHDGLNKINEKFASKNSQNSQQQIQKLEKLKQFLPKITTQENNFRPGGINIDDLPDEPTYSDYMSAPIETLGWSMLFGQGYVPGEGVGLSNKAEITPVSIFEMSDGGDKKAGVNVNKSGRTDPDGLAKLNHNNEQNNEQKNASQGHLKKYSRGGTYGLGITKELVEEREREKEMEEKGVQEEREAMEEKIEEHRIEQNHNDINKTSLTPSSLNESHSNSPYDQSNPTYNASKDKNGNYYNKKTQFDHPQNRDRDRQYRSPPAQTAPELDDYYRRSFPNSKSWVREGLHVKITNSRSEYYSHKGIIDRISQSNGDIAILIPNSNQSSSLRNRYNDEVRVRDDRDVQTVLPKTLPSLNNTKLGDLPAIIMVRGKYKGFVGYLTRIHYYNNGDGIDSVDVKIQINKYDYFSLYNVNPDDVCSYQRSTSRR